MATRELEPGDRVRLIESYGAREVEIAEVHKNTIVTVDREHIGLAYVEAIVS